MANSNLTFRSLWEFAWHAAHFQAAREARLEALRGQVAPLKARRLELRGEINRLTFESVLDPKGLRKPLGSATERLAALDTQIAPLQAQIDQLTRQFWVTAAQVAEHLFQTLLHRAFRGELKHGSGGVGSGDGDNKQGKGV